MYLGDRKGDIKIETMLYVIKEIQWKKLCSICEYIHALSQYWITDQGNAVSHPHNHNVWLFTDTTVE